MPLKSVGMTVFKEEIITVNGYAYYDLTQTPAQMLKMLRLPATPCCLAAP